VCIFWPFYTLENNTICSQTFSEDPGVQVKKFEMINFEMTISKISFDQIITKNIILTLQIQILLGSKLF